MGVLHGSAIMQWNSMKGFWHVGIVKEGGQGLAAGPVKNETQGAFFIVGVKKDQGFGEQISMHVRVGD